MNDPAETTLDRRCFLSVAASALAAPVAAAPPKKAEPGASARAIKALHDSLTPAQKKAMCFAWDHNGRSRVPLRLHVSNNWAVSGQTARSFTREQQGLIENVLA